MFALSIWKKSSNVGFPEGPGISLCWRIDLERHKDTRSQVYRAFLIFNNLFSMIIQ